MNFDYCIVGSGPAGLTLAYKLIQNGKRVLMVERDARPGGLSKSYNFDGHVFDTGPKRFHTDDPIVLNFINEIADTHVIGRSTKVFFFGKYFNWPLSADELYKLPAGVSAKALIDILRRPKIEDKYSFRDFIKSQYGATLYNHFFKPYTEKFLRWDVDDIHSDWASTGINRAVIDKRVNAGSMVDLVLSLALPKKVDTKFLYPTADGFGSFFDKLFSLCQASENFKAIFNDTIVELEDVGDIFNAVSRDGEQLSFENLVWSGNVNDLGQLVFHEQHDLRYLNTIFYNFICSDKAVRNNRAQWIYVSDGKSLISRLTCMREFSGSVCPDGYYNFICELTDSQLSPKYFKDPGSYKDAIVSELLDMNFLSHAAGIEDVRINPVIDTYPIYRRSYKKDFASITKKVRQFSKRIHLLGRSGAFWYNNSDHSIRMSLDMSYKLLTDPEHDFGYREYFGGGTQEEDEPGQA